MDYYEELGISPLATKDEIHRALRRLTKLLHPDQQTEQAMKLLAETQMRRLNAMVEVLSDPAQRRQYDSSLNGSWPPSSGLATPQPRYAGAPWKQRLTPYSMRWWVGSTIAAIVLTLGVVWFWADNLGSSFGDRGTAYTPPQVQDNVTGSARPDAGLTPPVSQKHPNALSRLRNALLPSRQSLPSGRGTGPERTKVPKIKNQPSRLSQGGNAASDERTESLVVVVPDRPPAHSAANESSDRLSSLAGNSAEKPANPPNENTSVHPVLRAIGVPPAPSIASNISPRGDIGSVPLPVLPVAIAPNLPEAASASKASVSAALPRPTAPAPSVKVSSLAISSKPVRQNPLEGEWVYAPQQPEKRTPGVYPPEFIDLKLFWNDGALHGQYRARYQITDKPISPDVSFVLSPADREARKFVWQSGNGSRGTFRISSINASSIRVEWRTTVFSHGPAALTAGMATLVRRSP